MMTQEIIAAKSAKLHAVVAELLQIVGQAVDQQLPAHEVERSVLKTALSVGRAAMEMFFDHLGVGDVGETCRLDDGRVLKRLENTRCRSYQTVFGTFELARYVYATREGQKGGIDSPGPPATAGKQVLLSVAGFRPAPDDGGTV